MIKGKKSFGKQLFGFLFDMCFAQHASLSILFSSLILYFIKKYIFALKSPLWLKTESKKYKIINFQ